MYVCVYVRTYDVNRYILMYVCICVYVCMYVCTRWYQKISRLGLYIKKYSLDSSLGTITFRIVPLCIDTALPAPLPPLERVLEVLFSRRV